MKQKIAVIGDPDSVLLFQALGIEVHPVRSASAAERAIHKLAQSEYAVIYITEPMAQAAAEAVARYRSALFPAIIPIPDGNGTTGLGMSGIRANVEKAIGSDILFGEER